MLKKKNILLITKPKNRIFSKKIYHLGYWCLEINKKNILLDLGFKKIHDYHWSNKLKLKKDFSFIENFLEKLLEDIVKALNKVHNVKYETKYWRIILYPWLSQYVSVVFDRWETIDTFLKKNNSKNFLVHDEFKKNYNFISKDYLSFFKLASTNNQWNDSFFKKILIFRKSKKIFLKNKIIFNYKVEKNQNIKKKQGIKFYIDKIISKAAFSCNKVIFESFYFPFKEYLTLNLKNNLIPARYFTFFDYNPSNNNFNLSLRNMFKDLINDKNFDNSFYNFLRENIHLDIPMSYLENFALLQEQAIKICQEKKIIFSMHSWHHNDFFRVYIAETIKRNKSKYIISDHGGGFDRKLNLNNNYYKKICYKKLNWIKKKDSFYLKLSPTHPVITTKKNFNISQNNKNITILYSECSSYQTRIQSIPYYSDEVENFKEFILAFKKIKESVKKKLIFRLKDHFSLKTDKIFSNVFGSNLVINSKEHNYYDSLRNSKLVLVSYPTTSYSECMYLNIPTILFCKKKVWMFSDQSLKIFKELKKNNMAFEEYDKLVKFLNDENININEWWNEKKIQILRKSYLKNFFNIPKSWETKWFKYVKKTKKYN